MNSKRTIGGITLVALLGCGVSCAEYSPTKATPPQPEREFRGAWIATVANINWPTEPGLPVGAQRAELNALFDIAVKNRLNAVMLQVRPAADALYDSKLEPWSEFLTGKMGQAPEPLYDPLKYAVDEAHKRGLELHAWFNPFRASHHSFKSPISPDHVSKTHPQWVRQYGVYLWLDPGEPSARRHSLKVIMDVVNRYDIDGVVFDDYFYPYPVKGGNGRNIPFPDDASWRKYGNKNLERNAWRRQNVNHFVRDVRQSIRKAKPWVRFGISPFGIWRPGQPTQIRGLDAYDALYADARTWFRNGWVDYLSPQLYWAIEDYDQSFPVLLEWWGDQNTQGRHLWPSLNTVKIGGGFDEEEIINQIRKSRLLGAKGQIHWSIGELVTNPAFTEMLRNEVYQVAALTPASPWLDEASPARPRLKITQSGSAKKATWTPGKGGAVKRWVLQWETEGRWNTALLSQDARSHTFDPPPDVIALRAVGRTGRLSDPVAFKR